MIFVAALKFQAVCHYNLDIDFVIFKEASILQGRCILYISWMILKDGDFKG